MIVMSVNFFSKIIVMTVKKFSEMIVMIVKKVFKNDCIERKTVGPSTTDRMPVGRIVIR